MTAKSVIQVDVDDSQFKSFYGLFQEYQAKLDSMPDDWKGVGEAIGEASDGMGDFSKATGASKDFLLIAAAQSEIISKEIRAASASNNALLASLRNGTKAQKEFADEAERGNKALATMKKSADGVAHSIFGIGKFLLKLGAIGGGLAGLGGILSAISLKDLAASAVDTQRTARGLGMTPGQVTAFNEDFGRYVDPSALGTIANQQGSLTGQMWLSRASGLDRRSVASQDPGQLASLLALKAHDWWANTPESQRNAETFQTTGLSQSGFSFEMARQEGNTPRSELERAREQYSGDQKRFNVSDQNTDSWYGFLRQIKDAGNTIETDLKNKLVALSPDLQRFVDVIGKDAKKLIDEIFTEKNLKSLETGIDTLTDYLGSSQFQQDIKDFAGLIGLVADKIRAAARFLGIDTSSTRGAGSQAPNVDPGLDPAEVQRETHGRMRDFGGISSSDKALGYTRHFLNMPSDPREVLTRLNQKNSLPPGTLEAIWAKESTEGKSRRSCPENGDQAIGDFQFTSDAWKQYGKGGDRFSFKDESDAAGRYMSDLMKKYKNDVSKALAAYNWGPGNVDKDIAKNGSNWQGSLPQETRDYINKIASALSKQKTPTLNVTVTNNTSARVAVQANAAAAQ